MAVDVLTRNACVQDEYMRLVYERLLHAGDALRRNPDRESRVRKLRRISKWISPRPASKDT